MYATIELINNKVALVRAKTKSGRLLPDDVDTTTIDQATTDILNFVQAQEPTEVEEALQIKEQAQKEVDQVKRELAETKQQVEETKEELSKAKSLFAKYDPAVKTYLPRQFLYDETNDKIVVINSEGQAEEAKPIEGAKATF